MALQKQSAHLNLTGGLQKKDDEFLVIPSKLAVADNVEFADASTVIRRGGQARLTIAANYNEPLRSFSHKGTPVLEFGNGAQLRANGRSTPSDFGHWRYGSEISEDPARFPRVGVLTRRIKPVVSTYNKPFDIACGTTAYCIVWPDSDALISSSNFVSVSIRDINTDVELQRNIIIGVVGSEAVSQPRVIYDSTNERFVIFTYHEDSAFVTSNVSVSRVPEAGGAFTGPTNILDMSYALLFTPMMDAAIYPAQGFAVCARDTSSGAVKIVHLNLALAVATAAVSRSVVTAPVSLTAHATYVSGVFKAHAFYGASTKLLGAFLPSDTGVVSAENTINTIGGSLVGRVVVTEVSDRLHLIYDVFTSTANTYAKTYLTSVTFAHGVSGSTSMTTNCFVAGRSFSMRSRNFVPLVFTSVWAQSTLLLLDITEPVGNLGTASAEPLFVARLDYGEVAYSSMGTGTNIRVPGASSNLLAYLKYETNLRIAGAVNVTPVCIAAAKFEPTEQLGHEEINGVTLLAGALPLLCDGTQIVEEGFHWGPEVATTALTPVTTGTGILTFPNTTGTYTVAFTEGWQDAQGNWHESAVAAEHTVSITSGSGLLDVNPTVIRPPSLKNGRSLVMYRTLRSSTDTSLYLTERTTLDADLVNSEQIYTAGNVLPNTPAPSCRHVSTFQKRLVLSGCGDGSRVHWSKVTTPGYGVEFSSGDSTHQSVVPASLGRAVATEELDDRLFVLCENGVGITYGTGPAATGTQGQYSDIATIITEVGASWGSPKSIVRGPEGIWFRSPFGLRLVSRAGSLGVNSDGKQAGSEVDSLISGDAIAVAGDAKQQIRFYQTGGTCLVWDYQWKQWTRFTGMACVDAVYADDRYYCFSNYSVLGSLDLTPLLRYTSDTTFSDVSDVGTAAQDFTGYIETPWLSFAGIQGFQRVYRLMMLGKNPTTAEQTIVGYFGFDFDPTSPPSTETFTAAVTPGTGGTVQLEHHFAKQKCESLKVGISFKPTSNANNGRFRLTDLTLQVGVKAGYNKLPSSKRY